ALILLAIVLIGVLAPLVYATSARHLSAYVDGGEDMGRTRQGLALTGADVRDVVSTPSLLADVKEPQKTLLMIVGPERRYDEAESDAILDFLHQGGRVLLADEGGFGTVIAREAGYAFDSSRVLDTRNHLGDPKLVVANSTLDG